MDPLIDAEEDIVNNNGRHQVARVAIKPPSFYRKMPEVWFHQLESQFAIAGITSDTTKFHHALAGLPEDVACDINFDDISYNSLKASVISGIKANRHQLIEEALATVELGDRRPTQLVTDIQRKFRDVGLVPDDTIIKSRVISALPSTIRSALVGHEDLPLTSFAKIADSMVAVAGRDTPFCTVNHIPIANKSFNNRPSPAYNNTPQSEIRQPRPFYSEQRPKLCNAHIYYAEAARTCRPWCKWPGTKPKLLQNRQQTPGQSRSNSPVN